MSSIPKIEIIRVSAEYSPRWDSSEGSTLAQARRRLAEEYLRIHEKVWPQYTDVIGEVGIARIAGSARMAPDSPLFPIVAARAAAQQLRIRALSWQELPPSSEELPVFQAFSEFDPKLHGIPTPQAILARMILRDIRILPLEERLPIIDEGLIAAWNEVLPRSSNNKLIQNFAGPDWLYDTHDDAPQPTPTPKPRILN